MRVQTTADDELALKVRTVCADVLRVPLERIPLSARFSEDLAVDSLFLVQLAIGLEEALEVDIPETALSTVQTVNDMVVYVASRRGDCS